MVACGGPEEKEIIETSTSEVIATRITSEKRDNTPGN